MTVAVTFLPNPESPFVMGGPARNSLSQAEWVIVIFPNDADLPLGVSGARLSKPCR